LTEAQVNVTLLVEHSSRSRLRLTVSFVFLACESSAKDMDSGALRRFESDDEGIARYLADDVQRILVFVLRRPLWIRL
jgi:hypothetical protein